MKNNFWFGVAFTFSICLTIYVFQYAYAVRGYNAIGSEVFMLALPLMIVFNKINKLQEKLNRKSRYIKQLEKQLNV
jgi:hypothetical protein